MKKLIYAKTRINGQEKHLADVSYKPVSYVAQNLIKLALYPTLYALYLYLALQFISN